MIDSNMECPQVEDEAATAAIVQKVAANARKLPAKTIAVIGGGVSSEHDVSLASSEGTRAAAVALGHRVHFFLIDNDGEWSVDGFPGTTAAWEKLRSCDLAIPMVHGAGGEDGVLQGFLETVGVPYFGSGVLSSAVGLDKQVTKLVAHTVGVRTAPGLTIDATLRDQLAETPDQAENLLKSAKIELPVFVKPLRGGSSFGVSKVTEQLNLADAVKLAAHGPVEQDVLIEPEVRGKEVDIGVLELPDGSVIVGPCLQVLADSKEEFFSTEAKYSSTETRFLVPAPIGDEASAAIRAQAKAVFTALGCRGLARVDFFVDDDGTATLNEINTLPGFTSHSQVPRIWAAAGVNYEGLVAIMIETALARTHR